MDEREVALLEGSIRRSLRSLDDVSVPTIASVRLRSAAAPAFRVSGAVVASALVILLALVAGDRLAAWRGERAASLSATATVMPVISSSAPGAVPTSVTRDQAIALVRSLTNEVLRVDRIEARLVPWSEFEPVGMGVDRTGAKAGQGEFPPQSVWAVAVAGDAYPNMGDRVPRVHYPWALYGINARLLQVASLKVGDSGTWPPGFDALADHPAQLVQPTTSPAPLRFDNLNAGPNALRFPIRDLAAADANAQHLFGVVSTGNLQAPPIASTPPTSALIRSDDGGANWKAVDGVTRWPTGVAALGSRVLVSDAGIDTAVDGVTNTGGLFLSTDGGSTWRRVLSEGIVHVGAFSYAGRTVFLAERWWPTRGAASGPSNIFASVDGETWRDLGQVPGPVTSFGLLDVPLVVYSKNVPADGVYRVEGGDLASLRLVSIPKSPHADGTLSIGPNGDLWSFTPNGTNEPSRSLDGGKTFAPAAAGLSGRIAGLFLWNGALYAVGDGAYQWDGSLWRVASILGPKATAVFQVGDVVFIQQNGDPPWRSPRAP